MDFDHFKKIVDNLSETQYKKDTIMRESIKPAEANFIGYLKIAHAFPAQTMPGYFDIFGNRCRKFKHFNFPQRLPRISGCNCVTAPDMLHGQFHHSRK
jgi:hypothetical protein